MEHGVNPEGLGKEEADSCWIDDLGDGEWADEARSKFTGLNTEGEVLR